MNAVTDPDSDDDGFRFWIKVFGALLCTAAFGEAPAQDATVGLVSVTDEALEGYTLFTPLGRDTTFLMDVDGRVVNTWPGESLQMAYLLEDGTLLRASNPGDDHFDLTVGGVHGTIEKADWEGNVVWSWTLSNDTARLHHDFAPMPNGNILVNAYELKSMDDVHAAGGDTTLYTEGVLYSEAVFEIRPIGTDDAEIVWEWHLWDHLVQNFDETTPNFGEPTENPQLIDLNRDQRGGIADWVHFNTVSYNPRRDEIALSTPHFNEIYILDHSTTTEEAAGSTGGRRGKGGDIIYRWGNPAEYGLGTEDDQRLFFQHDIQWIEPGLRGEGNLILFNNRYGESINEQNHSTIDELTPPLDADGNYVREPGEPFGPEELAYRFEADPPYEMESRIISGVQRLANGHTLICSGNRGNFLEVDENDDVVWQYRSPILNDGRYAAQDSLFGADENRVFKIRKYPPTYPGLVGKDLTPGSTLVEAVPPSPLADGVVPQNESSRLDLSPTFGWNPVEDADTYTLQLSTSPDFGNVEIIEDGISDTSFSLSEPLENGQIYYWKLRANNQFGTSRSSDILTFSVVPGGALQVALTSPPDEEPNLIVPGFLEWNPIADATYDLEVALDSTFEILVVSEKGFADTNYTATLDPLTSYYWRVRASNAGPLNWSETRIFETSVGPVTLLAPEDGATEVLAYTEFAWNPVDGAESYQLQAGNDTTFTTPTVDTTDFGTGLVPSVPLAYSTLYHWRVRGFREVGPGPWSEVGSFTIAVGTALDDVAANLPDQPDLKSNYPNPFRSTTTIEYDVSDAGHVELIVYDLLGHEVETLLDQREGVGRHSITLKAESYPSGIYLVRYETDGFSEVIRMVVAR